MIQYGLCSGLVGGAALYGAEESETEAIPFVQMEPYVVVSTRTPLSLDRVSPSVTYVSDEAIEIWQDTSLADVFVREPGMGIVVTGTEGATTSQFTRGTNSNHTSFFLDGRRLNPGLSSQYDISALTVDNLSSVQVERGAASVNYGSNSIGGVVDLRSHNAFQPGESGVKVEGEVGSNEYHRETLSLGAGAGDASFQMSATNLNTDNERPNDYYQSFTVRPRFDYKLTDHLSFELVGQYHISEKGVPGDTSAPTLTDYSELTNWLVSPGLLYCGENIVHHVFYSRSLSEAENFGAFGDTLGRVRSDELHYQTDYAATDDLELSLGLVYRNDEAFYSDIDFGPGVLPYENRTEQVGGYLQAIWEVSDRVELRGGVRYDDYSDYEAQSTGDLEGIYKFPDSGLSLFAKVANSYAPPRASDIAFDSDPSTTAQPEKAKSYEAGFRQVALDDNLKFSALYFYNDIKDLTEFLYTGVGITGYDIINVSEAQTDGVELKVDYTWNKKLNLFATYTYLTAIDKSTDERLVRRPRHTVTAGVHYAFTDAFNAGIQATGLFDREDLVYDSLTFTSSQVDQEDQFVMRLVADYAVTEQIKVFGRIENLFDHEYEPVIGYPALGRTYYVGASYTF